MGLTGSGGGCRRASAVKSLLVRALILVGVAIARAEVGTSSPGPVARGGLEAGGWRVEGDGTPTRRARGRNPEGCGRVIYR